MKRLLPLGTVVTVKGYNGRLMIYGRMQIDIKAGKRYDYLGCDYPIGVVDTMHGILFDDEAVDKLFYIGFQDVEELNFKNALSDYLTKESKMSSETR